MKVLFAVSSESISDAIVKKYQKEYKEILSYKNVYYFNAILKEIQKDKSYDRIVISEDLEPLSNNYDAIDKFIFEKLDEISDEAQDIDGNETSIILICTDRQTRGNSFLVKLFSIGIYNALLGAEKSIDNVCKLINKPRVKKEAKLYYKIDSDEANYSNKGDDEVNELEIQNILTHFKKLGKNTDKFAESFNNIAAQYTDNQLRIIVNCLPMSVKSVLEEDCPRYRELMSITGIVQKASTDGRKLREAQDKTGIKIDIIDNKEKTKMSGPIVIPASVRTSKNKSPMQVRPIGNKLEVNSTNADKNQKNLKKTTHLQNLEQTKTTDEAQAKKISQRPVQRVRKNDVATSDSSLRKKAPVPTSKMNELEKNKIASDNSTNLLRKKPIQTTSNIQKVVKQKKEEPIKNVFQDEDESDEINLNMIGSFDDDDLILPEKNSDFDELDNLPGLDDDIETLNESSENEESLPGIDDAQSFDEDVDSLEELPGMEDDDLPGLDDLSNLDNDTDGDEFTDEVELPELDELDDFDSIDETFIENNNNLSSEVDELNDGLSNGFKSSQQELESIKPKVDYSMSSLNSLLTKDKKIVTFIGTTKNGTSFLVNNLAALFSSVGINTAILDVTQNKNSYYIYTNNEEELRNIAYNSISKLQKGFAEGIRVDKNLTVYTALPNDGKDYSDAEPILSTLVQNHSLVLIDCDFETNPSYFASCQEIYLVQSMDILTIQPLTAFLRELKAKGVLESEKVRVVINKELKVKSLTTKAIIGGMSFYNDPSMSFMTELFNKDMVKACSIPFEDSVYSKYLDSMATCKLSLSGYSKQFTNQLKNLGNMVYPLVGKGNSGGKISSGIDYSSKKSFSSSMNNTLNQMKNKY